jgi:Holliday junction resolvase
MKKINSRTKGSKNERELAKLFKDWTGRDFARTPSSGGLQWKSANSKGDIVCTSEGHYFPFCIEAKSYREINFEHLLYSPQPKILEFWAQATRDAGKCNKIPLLFMRYNGMPKNLHFVVITQDTYKMFKVKPEKSLLFWSQETGYLQIIPSTDFFRSKYKLVKIKAKKYLGYGKKK